MNYVASRSSLFVFFYNFIFPSQHASNITFINILNHVLYLHTVFEFLGIYREGGLSCCENGTYRKCCTNTLGMYTPTPASPVISVCTAAKIKIVHGVRYSNRADVNL